MSSVSPIRVGTLLLFALSTTDLLAGGVRVDDPWVRAAPPTAKVMAGYMALVNESATLQHVVAASSPGFRMIEMHRSFVVDGMARMEEQERITIEPGARAVLEPGGYHLMLMMPGAVPKEGDRVNITLELESGETVAVVATVRRQ